MPDDPYSLADLARLADVTPRTVRYYVAQGLLPSPDAAGPATRYGEGHLLRLRLIRRLQREHLPLAEIRLRLEQMADDDVTAALGGDGSTPVEAPMDTDATLAYVRSIMTRAGVSPRFYDQPANPQPPAAAARLDRPIPDGFPVREAPEPGASPAAPPTTPPGLLPLPSVALPGRGVRSPAGDRSTWERLSITPDVEVHVRRPLDRPTNRRVERLIRIARELFEEDA